MVRRTDTGCEPRYLPQATEEDHGAHPFNSTGWNWCARLRGGGTIVSAGGVTTWVRVMKNMTLGAFAGAAVSATAVGARLGRNLLLRHRL
jgi:hypothetical protein